MQQRESCLMKIHETEDSLSPKERQLASYILRHAEDVVNLRIDELKIRAGVSTSTVIRLSKALGFAGYKDWMIDRFAANAFTIEAGRGVNPLPIDALPTLYAENEGILVEVLRRADT